jgi:hypothetical protein
MAYCARCGEWNSPETLDCSCGEPLPATLPAAPRFSYTPSAAQFAFLYFVTGGIYGLYWYFKLWRVTAAMLLKDEHPWRNTLLTIVPIYNIYLYFSLFSEATASVGQARLRPRASFAMLAVFGALLAVLYKLPGDWWYVSFLAFVPFAIVQYYVTEAQLRLWGDSIRPYKYRWGDWILIIIGSLILLLNLPTVFLFPADNPQPWVLPVILVIALISIVILRRFKLGSSIPKYGSGGIGGAL